jgi:hypothetical protein
MTWVALWAFVSGHIWRPTHMHMHIERKGRPVPMDVIRVASRVCIERVTPSLRVRELAWRA